MKRSNPRGIKLVTKGDAVSPVTSEAPAVVSDDFLVKEAKAGNKEAFRALVEKYQQKIYYRVLDILKNPEDSRDLAQESFVKAYISLNQFKGESSFYTWIYRIAFNMSIDYKRRYARRGGDPLEFDEKQISDSSQFLGSDPSSNLLRKQQSLKINEAFKTLTEDHKAAIILREVDGLSYEEIAESLGVSRGTVMSRLHYARKKLQGLLKDFAPDGVDISNTEEEV